MERPLLILFPSKLALPAVEIAFTPSSLRVNFSSSQTSGFGPKPRLLHLELAHGRQTADVRVTGDGRDQANGLLGRAARGRSSGRFK